MAELIVFGKYEEINYLQKCKIVINAIKKCLILTPANQENFTTDYNISFDKHTFVQQRNILCAFPVNNCVDCDGCNFALIFSNSEKCEKVYNAIQKIKGIKDIPNQNDDDNRNLFEKFFFRPILKEIKVNNKTLKSCLTIILSSFFESLSVKETKKYMLILEELQMDALNFTSLKLPIDKSHTDDTKINSSVELPCDTSIFKTINNSIAETSKNPQKEINVQIETQKNDRRKSLRKRPIIDNNNHESSDEGDSPALKRRRLPIKYFSMHKPTTTDNIPTQIIEQANYKIEINVTCLKLSIFDDKNKKLCYVYNYDINKKRFRCIKCKVMGKYVIAKTCNDDDGKEYAELFGEHICKPSNYIPKVDP